jgi:phosphohistidine phosphatase
VTTAERPRILQLVRHAKSSWSDPSVADVDRPLSERGVRAAEALARRVADRDARPDLVVCSPATRARQTLAAILPILDPNTEIRIEPLVYEEGPDELLELLRTVQPAATRVMVVGHNPTMQDLALYLVDPAQSARVEAKFPTGAFATLVTTESWDRLIRGCARREDRWTPR